MSKKKRKSQAGRYVISMSNGIVRLFIDLLFYVIVAYAIYKLSIYAKSFSYQLFGSVQVDDYDHAVEKDILIELGDSTRDVGKRLERDGIIVNELSFYIKVKINKLNIMPGTYKLRTDMNYDEILNIIAVSTEKLEEEEELPDE
ncbi:MAG: endolytic transglycosylase MltG [Lachnospiraceae bacterium]|nr:endolytic transglycosylase MltG [Lachnospiraceae bacterium]